MTLAEYVVNVFKRYGIDKFLESQIVGVLSGSITAILVFYRYMDPTSFQWYRPIIGVAALFSLGWYVASRYYKIEYTLKEAACKDKQALQK